MERVAVMMPDGEVEANMLIVGVPVCTRHYYLPECTQTQFADYCR